MSEPAVFAGEFAEADGSKRCSGHRKFFISSLELVFICSLNDKQEFLYNLLFFLGKFCAI